LISYCSGVLHDSDEEEYITLYSYGNISDFSWNYFVYVPKDLSAAEEAKLGGMMSKIIPIDFKEDNESLIVYAIKPYLFDEAICSLVEEMTLNDIFVLNLEKKINKVKVKHMYTDYNPYFKIIYADERNTYLKFVNKTPYRYIYGCTFDYESFDYIANETLRSKGNDVISSSRSLLNKRNKFYEGCFNVSYKENETYGNAVLPGRYASYIDFNNGPQYCGTDPNKFLLSWKFSEGKTENLCKNKTLYLKINAGNNAKAIISNAYFVYNNPKNNTKGLRIFPFVVPCEYFDEKCDLTKNYTLEINFSEDVDFVEITGVKLCEDCEDKDKMIYESMDCKKNSSLY